MPAPSGLFVGGGVIREVEAFLVFTLQLAAANME
jgi:hypothetical protein